MSRPRVAAYKLRDPRNKMTRGNVLVLKWNDDHETQYASYALRMECPCMGCRQGDSLKGVPAQVEIQNVELKGYALRIEFSDGHNEGIYPLDYLYNYPHNDLFI